MPQKRTAESKQPAQKEETKMSEIATKYGSQSVAAVGRDPFEVLADEMAPQTILGTLIRFSKGDYLAGADGEIVPLEGAFVAAVDHALGGWVHWRDKRPDQQLMTPLASGASPPPRHMLGDDSVSSWEMVGNERRDPWQPTFYLPLLSSDDEIFTFTSSSAGGRRAIGNLFREYGKHRRTGADEYPIVGLGVEGYTHREYGRIRRPAFNIAGWESRQRFLDALTEAGIQPLDLSQYAPPPAPEPAAAPTFVPNRRARAGANLRVEMDDEIPF